MSDEQPELRWAPLPPKPRSRWHIWLIVVLAAVVIAALTVFLVFILPNGFRAEPAPTTSASPSATAPAPSADPTPVTPEPSPSPVPTDGVDPTPPPVPDPSIDVFADRVRPVLDDAETGLRYAVEDGGESGATDVQLVRQDAERLTDLTAPASIADAWSSELTDYLSALDVLFDAYMNGDDVDGAQQDAEDSLQRLRDIVGV